MNNIGVINYNNWIPYDGFSEGSGRSEKIWLQSPEGKIGLFKYPKVDPETSKETTEHISEHLAYQIGTFLGVPTAIVDIGTYEDRIGCMSYLLNAPDEIIVEGAIFISGKHPDYDMDQMRELSTGRYYCLDHLLEVSDSSAMLHSWIEMMVFDFLIGNTDRHQNNWAVLIKPTKDIRYMEAACPLYDNGSSLCCYINEKKIPEFLGKDITRFNALVDTKSRSMIRIDGYNKTRPTHAEVVRFLMKKYPVTMEIAVNFITRLDNDTISFLTNQYKGLMTDNKIELICRFLVKKKEILERIVSGV